MENEVRLPSELCQKLFNCEFELDIGNITQDLVAKTIELYVEAISIYTNHVAENIDNLSFDKTAANRRHQYYQEKIKKLLVRTDVQQCLVGKKHNPKALDLHKQLCKVNQKIPEQAKALIEYYKNHHKNLQALINRNLSQQSNELNDRIERRSKSKSKKTNTQSNLERAKQIYVASNLSYF